MGLSTIAKWIIVFGIGTAVLGFIIWLVARGGFSIGKLPGDVHIQREKFSLYIPLLTSLILSLFLTIIVNLILWFFRK